MTSDWLTIGLGILSPISGAIGGMIGYQVRKRGERVAAEPIIRWRNGLIEFVNRINEDLTIERIATSGTLFVDAGLYDDGGSYIPGRMAQGASFEPNWTIRPLRTENFTLWVDGSSSAIVTISSSNRTLRSRRMKARMSKSE